MIFPFQKLTGLSELSEYAPTRQNLSLDKFPIPTADVVDCSKDPFFLYRPVDPLGAEDCHICRLVVAVKLVMGAGFQISPPEYKRKYGLALESIPANHPLSKPLDPKNTCKTLTEFGEITANTSKVLVANLRG